MYHFFETICVKDGVIQRLAYHQKRVDDTRACFYPTSAPISLDVYISVPDFAQKGTFRCRVCYGEYVGSVTFFPYVLRTHCRIKLIEQPTFRYDFKAEDRSFFVKQLEENPEVDEILFTQNGFLTDTTYAHVLLRHDSGEWCLPNTYLLPGTKARYLLDNKLIISKDIRIEDLGYFNQIALVNAMRDFEEIYAYTFQQATGILELKKI